MNQIKEFLETKCATKFIGEDLYIYHQDGLILQDTGQLIPPKVWKKISQGKKCLLNHKI